jgi:hypothetical protein
MRARIENILYDIITFLMVAAVMSFTYLACYYVKYGWC